MYAYEIDTSVEKNCRTVTKKENVVHLTASAAQQGLMRKWLGIVYIHMVKPIISNREKK